MLCMILYGFATLFGVVIALFVLDGEKGLGPQDVPLVPPKAPTLAEGSGLQVGCGDLNFKQLSKHSKFSVKKLGFAHV